MPCKGKDNIAGSDEGEQTKDKREPIKLTPRKYNFENFKYQEETKVKEGNSNGYQKAEFTFHTCEFEPAIQVGRRAAKPRIGQNCDNLKYDEK